MSAYNGSLPDDDDGDRENGTADPQPDRRDLDRVVLRLADLFIHGLDRGD
jgi:hypothetical protein